MPARRTNRKNIHNNSPKKKKFPLLVLVLLCAFLMVYFFWRLSVKNFWDKNDRLIVAFHKESGEVVLVDADPVAHEIVSVSIPANVEIESAGNYGKRRIGNIWNLGFQEKLDGSLLSSSITNSFYFPVVAWSDEQGLDLIDGGIFKFLKALIKIYRTNLSFSDKFALGIFARSVDNIHRTNIRLEETNLIKKAVLEDGESGYLLTGFESSRINSYFSDYHISSAPTKIVIEDKSAKLADSTETGKVLEIMGAKVVAVNHSSETGDFVCLVSPKSDKRSEIISAVFGCQLTGFNQKNTDEIVVTLGKKFAQKN